MLFPFSSKVLLRLDVSFLFRITTFLPIHPIDGRINTNKVGESRSDTDLIESNIYIYIYIYIIYGIIPSTISSKPPIVSTSSASTSIAAVVLFESVAVVGIP